MTALAFVDAPAFCPHCGSDLRLDQPIILDDFSMFGDGYPLIHNNVRVPLSPLEGSLVWTLLKAFPHMVSADAIVIRIGSECSSNVVDVLVSRIRASLRKQGMPNHIETMRGRGYRWSLTPQQYSSHGGGRPQKTKKATPQRASPSLSAK